GPADDHAIATDKQALLPGGTASFDNYSSYNRGINGIMIDVANLANPAAVRVDDFQFLMGNDPDTAAWQPAPQPTGVSVRQGAGVGGSDRITLTWADGAILGKWVKVSVRATDATGLAVSDDFYFGSAPGEAGDSATDA